jgi:hypothetical protein
MNDDTGISVVGTTDWVAATAGQVIRAYTPDEGQQVQHPGLRTAREAAPSDRRSRGELKDRPGDRPRKARGRR